MAGIRSIKSALLCALASTAFATQAGPITLNANGGSFGAELLVGTSDIGVVFFHGRGQSPDGDVVRQLRTQLNALGHTTLALDNPQPVGGTDFANYAAQESAIDDEVFGRLDAALATLDGLAVQRVVLAGFSLGSRFMTAATAAWEHGVYSHASGLNLLALIGVGMYGALDGSAPTLSAPLVSGDFNVLDTHTNLSFIGVPVLDLYGDQDLSAVANAALRRSQYAGLAGDYQQASVQCPPNDGSYFARVGSSFEPYYGADQTDFNRCHQLRNGWRPDGQGGYVEHFIVRGAAGAPLEMHVGAFMAQFSADTGQPVTEPGALALIASALLALRCLRRIDRNQ